MGKPALRHQVVGFDGSRNIFSVNTNRYTHKQVLWAFDGLTIDMTTREVVVKGQPIATTAKEFDLLAFLAGSPRQVFSREQLLRQVWESSSDWQSDATITEHVRRLRRKIEVDPDNPRWITTVRGVGYRFEP